MFYCVSPFHKLLSVLSFCLPNRTTSLLLKKKNVYCASLESPQALLRTDALLALPSHTRDYIRKEDTTNIGSAVTCPQRCKSCFAMNSHHKPHFTDTHTGPEKFHDWPHVSPLGSGRAGIQTHLPTLSTALHAGRRPGLEGHVIQEWTGHTCTHGRTH